MEMEEENTGRQCLWIVLCTFIAILAALCLLGAAHHALIKHEDEE